MHVSAYESWLTMGDAMQDFDFPVDKLVVDAPMASSVS